ncbi:MAG TPA: hypothetical protein VFF49_06620 [Thermodesulfobacteriota bacterium]|nr:hypothetical protein [Thermodesulfobacteriota bacterium]
MSETKVVEGKKPRRQFRDESWTEEQVAARRVELTVAEVPAGYVKLADLSKRCQELSIPVSKMVRATGGDRGMNSPLHPIFQIVFVGRTRYLHGEVMTTGIDLLQSEEFGKTPRKPRAKKEKAEGEGGAVKSAKKEKKVISVKATPIGNQPGVSRTNVWEAPSD